MDQKQRNKIAYGLTALLVPLLIYLLVTNLAKVRKTPSPQTPPALGVSPAPGAKIVPPVAEVQPPTRPAGNAPATTSSAAGGLAGAGRSASPIDPKVLAEQKRIAALFPDNNPFNPSRPVIAEPLPVTAAPVKTAAPPPPTAPDAGIKLTAILARGGGRMAMINGRFLGEGDHIAGWTIIKVNARDVLLKNGDQQMVLRLK